MGKRAAVLRELDRQTRRAVRERDGDLCIVSGRPASAVHEILPKSHFGVKGLHYCFEMKNRCCLCEDVHRRVHTRPGRMMLLRKMRDLYGYNYDDDPWREYMEEYGEY